MGSEGKEAHDDESVGKEADKKEDGARANKGRRRRSTSEKARERERPERKSSAIVPPSRGKRQKRAYWRAA